MLVEVTPGAVEAGAAVLERRARVNLLAASGGDGRLSRARTLGATRAGKAGSRVDVKLVVRGAGRRAVALVLPVGPVSLVEKPTTRHRIPRKLLDYAYRRRVYQRRGVWIPGIGFRASVDHPGTRGKRPVGRAMDTHHDEAATAGLEHYTAAVERHLRGA